jgi:predicted dehydrogenase
MSNPTRVGVIGAGAIAMYGHIPGIKRHPQGSVVAVCDTNKERAEALATSQSVAKVYTDWRELVKDPEIDAVTIALPNALHAEVAIAALKAGKHVLSEKPLAMTVAQGEEMVATAEKEGRVLAVNMTNRPRGEFQYMKAKIAEGRIGKVSYATGRMIRRAGIPGFGSWFTRKELAGGGALLDIGVHMLDAVLYMLGNPKISALRGEVQAVHGPQRRGLGGWGIDRVMDGTFDVDDLASLHLRLADGGLVTIEVTWAIYGQNEERVQITGDQGGFDFFPQLYGTDKPLRYYSDDNGSPIETIPTLPTVQDGAGNVGYKRFIDAIQGKGTVVASGAEGLAILRLLEATYRSAAEKREITL